MEIIKLSAVNAYINDEQSMCTACIKRFSLSVMTACEPTKEDRRQLLPLQNLTKMSLNVPLSVAVTLIDAFTDTTCRS